MEKDSQKETVFLICIADGPFQDMTRSSRPRNTRPREDRSVRQIKSLCQEIRSILRLKDTAIGSSNVARYLSNYFIMKSHT